MSLKVTTPLGIGVAGELYPPVEVPKQLVALHVDRARSRGGGNRLMEALELTV